MFAEMYNMQEFDDFIGRCQSRLSGIKGCGLQCNNNHYCTVRSCAKGDCAKCLEHIQWGKPPAFTYSCPKITYHYVLKLFPRFASEICHLLRKCGSSKNTKNVNVVSLGCGPGSEVYGIIEALRSNFPNYHLRYDGFDQNSVWSEVQAVSKSCLASSGHEVEFHIEDMFSNPGVPEHIDMLVLNYVLSDVAKFHKNDLQAKSAFCDQTADFITSKKIRIVLFNDINLYGFGIQDNLDSGLKMMKEIYSRTQCINKRFWGYCFPGDKCNKDNWPTYSSSDLIFPAKENGVNVAANRYCGSKQMISVFTF